jgi:hypothetical protein
MIYKTDVLLDRRMTVIFGRKCRGNSLCEDFRRDRAD